MLYARKILVTMLMRLVAEKFAKNVLSVHAKAVPFYMVISKQHPLTVVLICRCLWTTHVKSLGLYFSISNLANL